MNARTPRRLAAALVPVLMLTTLAATAAPAPEAAFRSFLATWRQAWNAHDAATLGRLTADDVRFVDYDSGETLNRAAFLAEAGRSEGHVPAELAGVEELQAWRVGNMLFANYRTGETAHYGTQVYRTDFRATFVLEETASGPRVRLFQGTRIPNFARASVHVDPAGFERYVGEYSAGPGDRLIVTREGEKLMVSDGAGWKAELKAADAHTFFATGAPDDWRFVEDAQGRVTGLESTSFGQTILASKVR